MLAFLARYGMHNHSLSAAAFHLLLLLFCPQGFAGPGPAVMVVLLSIVSGNLVRPPPTSRSRVLRPHATRLVVFSGYKRASSGLSFLWAFFVLDPPFLPLFYSHFAFSRTSEPTILCETKLDWQHQVCDADQRERTKRVARNSSPCYIA